jgi:hypothetical protein
MRPGELLAAARQLHEHPRVVSAAATPTGNMLVFLAATLLLPSSLLVYTVSPLLALSIVAPQRRSAILAVGSTWVLYDLLWRQGVTGLVPTASAFALVGALLYLCFLAARSYRRLPLMVEHNAQVLLHVLMWVGLASTWYLPWLLGIEPPRAARVVRSLLPFLIWRCGYLLLSGRRGSGAKSGFLDHLFYCLPIYGGTDVPFGKGHDHLTRHGATTPEALARSRLAGLKLLVLVWVWTEVRRWLTAGVYGEVTGGPAGWLAPYGLHIPHLARLIARGGGSVSLPVAWFSLLFELIDVTLLWAASGHMIIGCLRLFGYNVFRNTYRPLLAQSIVEFWNRFYYYFKELMVEFFFFPTYAAYFKTRPRLRMFVAIMAAAWIGNIYHHSLRDIDLLVNAGWRSAWALISPRVFYAFWLGLGIFVSMQREQQRRGAPQLATPRSALRQLQRIAGVWLFYSLIHIWNVQPIGLTFTQRTSFFLSLFGI